MLVADVARHRMSVLVLFHVAPFFACRFQLIDPKYAHKELLGKSGFHRACWSGISWDQSAASACKRGLRSWSVLNALA